MLYLNKRQLMIIRYLLNSSKPLSSDFLAVVLGSNAKTIKNDMHVLNTIIGYFGAVLISKSGIGYYLNVTDKSDFATFVQTFNSKYKDNYFFPSNNTDRTSFIINKLITAPGYIKTESIQEELFISRTTFSADFKRVRSLLKAHKLFIKTKPNHGIKIAGQEIHIRYLMADYLNVDEDDYNLSTANWNMPDFGKVKSTLIRKMNEMNIFVNNSSVNKIVNLLRLSNMRYIENKPIDLTAEQALEFSAYPEYILMKELLENLKLDLLANNQSETAFLALTLISRRVYKKSDKFEIQKEKKLYSLANKIEVLLYDILNIDLFYHTDLKINLCKHLRGLIIRLRFGIEKKDLPLLSIKQSSSAFELAVLVCKCLGEQYELTVDEAEIAYMAYIFDTYYSKFIILRKYKLLLIMSSGLTIAHNYNSFLQNNFGNRIKNIHCIEFYQLEYTNIDEFDCIITDIPVINYDVNIPVLQFNMYVDSGDKPKLAAFFSKSSMRSQEFLSCFHKELFFSNVALSTKDEVIRFLSKEIEKKIMSVSQMAEMVMERESISSTECEHCVALPHTLYFAGKYTYIAVCILKRPILWDKENVQAVFLTANGQYDTYPYINLGIMKKVVSDKDFVYAIIKKPHYKDFVEQVNAKLIEIDFVD